MTKVSQLETPLEWTSDEIMTVVAARELTGEMVCFVGIGLPSRAAILARSTHAPNVTLVYESGCIGAKPDRVPPSIGDGVLSRTADAVVSVPEIFSYWLQAGRIDVGFLGAAQVDKRGNINTTVVGDYDRPNVRLPGAGGAPEITTSCGKVIITLRHSARAFVEKLDFVTSVGHVEDEGLEQQREQHGRGPQVIVTDLCVLRYQPSSREFAVTSLHPGVTVDDVLAKTGWPVIISDELQATAPPTQEELVALRGFVATLDEQR
jgi:glutaconate CoA-transferase, subunit B